MPNLHSGFCHAREMTQWSNKNSWDTRPVNRSIELRRLQSRAFIRLSPLGSKNGEKTARTHSTCRTLQSQNSKHLSHISTKFLRSSTRALEKITAVLGPGEVTCHSGDSGDDKAKVPIGITAAKKQTPLLMRREYQVICLTMISLLALNINCSHRL